MAQLPLGKTVLRIESWSNAARTLLLRGVSGLLPFSFSHTTNADRSRASDDFTIDPYKFIRPEILSVAPVTVPVRRGECFIRVTLLHGSNVIAVLSAAYLTDSKTITWPPGVFESSTEGPGYIHLVTGTNPAAGAEITEAVPTNARWRLLALLLGLVTDATVVNRTVTLVLDNGVTNFYYSKIGPNQGASLTRIYQYVENYGFDETAFDVNRLRQPIPLGHLAQGFRIKTATGNIQAGDDYVAPTMVVEEWIEE